MHCFKSIYFAKIYMTRSMFLPTSYFLSFLGRCILFLRTFFSISSARWSVTF